MYIGKILFFVFFFHHTCLQAFFPSMHNTWNLQLQHYWFLPVSTHFIVFIIRGLSDNVSVITIKIHSPENLLYHYNLFSHQLSLIVSIDLITNKFNFVIIIKYLIDNSENNWWATYDRHESIGQTPLGCHCHVYT